MPGIYSARYAGAGATDKDKIAKVLSELNEKLKTILPSAEMLDSIVTWF